MQRWIAAAVVAVMLVSQAAQALAHLGPLQINRELTEERQMAMAKELFEKLGHKEVLLQTGKDLLLAEKLQLASPDEAAAEVGRRLFVKVGEADSTMGKAPSINVGANGVAREKMVSEEIATRLVKKVWTILGIQPSQQREF